MRRRFHKLDKRWLAILIQALILGFFIFKIPPKNPIFVIIFILLLASLISIISSFFVAKKYQFLLFAFVLFFLGVNYLVGFQILNTLFLILFIVAVGFLI